MTPIPTPPVPPAHPLTLEGILSAYANTLSAYYEAEARFIADPSHTNVDQLHRSLSRLVILRDEIILGSRIGDALQSTKYDSLIAESIAGIPNKSTAQKPPGSDTDLGTTDNP